jgi:hypothetical protein
MSILELVIASAGGTENNNGLIATRPTRMSAARATV